MIEDLTLLFSDHTIQIVALGSMVLGLVSGVLGSFAVLRQQSLLGDAIAHATLPGVCLAFMLTQSKAPYILLLGAGIAGWLGTLLVMTIVNSTRIKRDAALGIVLSVFFGLGLVILTMIQRMPTASKAGLNKFLFGSAATLLKVDVITMIVLGCVALLVVILFWKEFKVISFDPDFAQSIGFNTRGLEILLTSMIVVAIVTGLQMVGVVLMSAMLVAPAAAARQWTDRLGVMVMLAALFGCLSGVAGAITSSMVRNLPTGPTIVLYVSAFVLVSLLLAPNRGLVWDWIRTYRNRRSIQMTTMLKNLLLFSEIHTDPFHPHDIAALKAIGRGAFNKTMQQLEKRGWVQQFDDKRWALTPQGLKSARRMTEQYERTLT